MSRKNPSAHSDEHFALFVEKLRSSDEEIDKARFKEMVEGLVKVDPEAALPTAAIELVISNRAAATNGPQGANPSATAAGSANVTSRDDESTDEARKSGTGSPDFPSLIGGLVFQWSRSQGLLVRLLALMLETDGSSAAAIFSTLSTTQLRLDLVRRLALLKVGDRQTLHELSKIIDDLDDACRLRDELIHAAYPVKDQDEIMHPQIMRFLSTETAGLPSGESEVIEEQRVADIGAACDNLRVIGRALEKLLPRIMEKLEAYGLREAAD